MLRNPFVKHIHRSPARGRRVAGVLGIRIFRVTSNDRLGWNRGLKCGTKRLRVERVTDRENRIAKDFGFEPLRTAPPQQSVVWIQLRAGGRVRWRALTIDRAGQNQAMQRLELPAAFGKLPGKPLQKLWM